MNSLHTHYDTLMVSRNASPEVIRAAFRSLSQKYHPDKNNHPDANRIMQQFNESYKILSDPIERSKYDKLLNEYARSSNDKNKYDHARTSNHSDRKNKVVVINIPDSVSFSRLKDYLSHFSSKIKPLLIKAFKIIFYIAVLIFLINIFFSYIDGSSEYNAAEDLSDAQREVADAMQELNEASEEYEDYEEYSYPSDTAEYAAAQAVAAAERDIAAAQTIEQGMTDISVDEDYMSTNDMSSYKNYAPNGEPYPVSAGYVAGYPRLNNNGASILTIDNSRNTEAVFGKLYYLDGSKLEAVRYFYIPGGGGLNLRDISPGNYDVRYKGLQNGSISKSETILMEEYEDYDSLRFSEITMTLYKVSNGNMQTYSISESEF